MTHSFRKIVVAFGIGILVVAGCDKNDSSGKAPPAPGGPSQPPTPRADVALYSKKLVGTWEATEDVGGKAETITMEFKTDGSMKFSMGPFNLKGTWKLASEEGKTVMVDTEMTFEELGDPKAPPKFDKKKMKAVFEDDNTVTISQEGSKPDPKKFKRKS